jgi:transcriptional regulator with XRE-family HTH domain
MKKYGEQIRKLRKEKGLKVYELAKQVGISDTFMTQIERGYRNPSAEVDKALTKIFDNKPRFTLLHELAHIRLHQLQKEMDATKATIKKIEKQKGSLKT